MHSIRRVPLALGVLAAFLIVGGPSISTVFAAQGTDPAGDVTLPNADIISSSASISGRMVDLRVRFVAAPFPPTHTMDVTWLLDIDRNASTTNENIAPPQGMDLVLAAGGVSGFKLQADGIGGIDMCLNGSVDLPTNTFRMLFPASLLPGVTLFNYGLDSNFGGSFGHSDSAPDTVNFKVAGGFFASDNNPPAPFSGVLLCTPEVAQNVLIDIRPFRTPNIINGNGGTRVPVAILSHGGFDAVADVDQESLQFGWTGQEPSIVGCDATPTDVDGDGLMDLVCDFSEKKMGFQAGDTIGVLQGRLANGTLFRGSDSVTITGTQH